jgi:hypothetical protein
VKERERERERKREQLMIFKENWIRIVHRCTQGGRGGRWLGHLIYPLKRL